MREAARKKEDYEKLPTAVQKQESPEWSQTLSLAEVQGIQAALEAVGDEREQLEAEGLSRVSWSIGVVNVVLTTLVFGKAPEYMWVMYAVKCYIYIPGWWYKVHRLYNGGLYILDFCWVMSICFGVYMSALLMDVLSPRWRLSVYLVFYSCGLGPLGWACIALHNGIIFHSIERIASLFIHITPALVTFTISICPEELERVWPGRFPTVEELAEVSLLQLYVHGLVAYATWLVLHATWLLSIGISEPSRIWELSIDVSRSWRAFEAMLHFTCSCTASRAVPPLCFL
eukprot:gnl/TRDRNA2_/TRDRNA2_80778_c0_seq3.p1 gnl/TRDRNA2_/TRDRNA2_80778_c0~~gnl/TRDRNA2_/TRDRNA2_80778_c0_seq3.p1  ORF type:complete len:286 (-),score=46.90 gnl/TRDRNA2_/TRDRNA2_80778_c0_seq3:386-1243(-)